MRINLQPKSNSHVLKEFLTHVDGDLLLQTGLDCYYAECINTAFMWYYNTYGRFPVKYYINQRIVKYGVEYARKSLHNRLQGLATTSLTDTTPLIDLLEQDFLKARKRTFLGELVYRCKMLLNVLHLRRKRNNRIE